MSTIPKEIMEKIEEKFQLHKWMDNVMWNENQRQRTAAEYGYKLATDGPEKEKECEELKEVNGNLVIQRNEYMNAFDNKVLEIIAQSKQIEELKAENERLKGEQLPPHLEKIWQDFLTENNL